MERNASWRSALRSSRTRRLPNCRSQASVLSTTQRYTPNPLPCAVPRRAITGQMWRARSAFRHAFES